MGIEALIGSLVADGTAEAERIRQAARDDAAAIVAEATARGEGGIAAARAAAEAELRTQVAEALFKARRDGRRAVLLAREEALERVRLAAASTLGGAHDDAVLRAVLPALVKNAVAYLPDGPAVARCHPDVAALVREAVRERRGVEVREDESAPPGVVLEDAQGRVRVEETLAVRLTRLWPVLRMQVARRMAPEGV
ncbi:MAG TPA: V-type ATP synthase subunit E [Gemmatimonadaceae bacterium]